jgi:hypothetical protein
MVIQTIQQKNSLIYHENPPFLKELQDNYLRPNSKAGGVAPHQYLATANESLKIMTQNSMAQQTVMLNQSRLRQEGGLQQEGAPILIIDDDSKSFFNGAIGLVNFNGRGMHHTRNQSKDSYFDSRTLNNFVASNGDRFYMNSRFDRGGAFGRMTRNTL